jgi:23S rRNA (uracil1939-C5)-methyltransferase
MLVRIERMAPQGMGLGRAACSERGKVIFVPYAAPGDVVEVEMERVRPGFCQARLLRLDSPGPGRVEPPCPLHCAPGRQGPACGGCDWQHLSPQAQLEAKREVVRDCLFRIAKLRSPEVEPVIPAPTPWRYRNKVLVPFGRGGPGGVVAGFYSPGSHRIVGFEDCPVQPELSVRLVRRVRAMAASLGWSVYDEAAHSGWLRHLFVRTNSAGQAMAALVTRTPEFRGQEGFVAALRAEFPELAGLFQNVQPLKTPVVLGPSWRRLWGADRLEERLGALRLLASPAAFLQVNSPACELLYREVRDGLCADGKRPSLALDLYCGVGSIALWVADACGRVLGFDESREAVADAWENARLNGIRNARFHAGAVETQLGRIRRALGGVEPGGAAVILDPPRSGCAKPVLKALADPAVGRVLYVSCNPATLARDVDWLCRHRWRLSRVQPVDLFPQTSHVETLALLVRT